MRLLCHDLRQPLATASGLAGLLAQESGLSEAGRHRVDLLCSELLRLSAMIVQTLSAPQPVRVDLAEAVRAARARFDVGSARKIELVIKSEPVVSGDAVLVHRMLDNLVMNAQTAAGPGGRVRLVLSQRAELALLSVEDAGTCSSGGSTPSHGLGLLIAQAIVARHGGSLDSSASDLGGLRITARLPLLTSPHTTAE